MHKRKEEEEDYHYLSANIRLAAAGDAISEAIRETNFELSSPPQTNEFTASLRIAHRSTSKAGKMNSEIVQLSIVIIGTKCKIVSFFVQH